MKIWRSSLYHFFIDLKIWQGNSELIFFLFLKSLKNIVKRSCDYPFIRCFELSNHCVCLPSSSLPIGQNSSIKPLNYAINHRISNNLVNSSLRYLRRQQIIKAEILLFHWILPDYSNISYYYCYVITCYLLSLIVKIHNRGLSRSLVT